MSGKNGGFIEIHIEGKAKLIAISNIVVVCDHVIALNYGEMKIKVDESFEEIKKQLM